MLPGTIIIRIVISTGNVSQNIQLTSSTTQNQRQLHNNAMIIKQFDFQYLLNSEQHYVTCDSLCDYSGFL